MRNLFVLFILCLSQAIAAQQEKDTLLPRCPVYIIDTLTYNNFFVEFSPATVKAYRSKGKLAVVIQQRDQYFTIFFTERKLENNKYKIVVGETRKELEVEAKYSFRSGQSASYVSVSKGFVDCRFDKEKGLWHIIVDGLLSNLAANTVSTYKVKADFFIE